VNYEDEFKSWLKEEGFADSVQSNYPTYLRKHIPSFLSQINIIVKDLFLQNDIEILQSYLLYFQKKGELYALNQGKNNFPSASLKKYIEFLKITNFVLSQEDSKIEKKIKYPLIKNIILYGPPGVGKTHNTNKLISLIESGISEKEIFETIKNNELNDVVDIDNIKDRVKFITFHQSFGYEDFIEGFRPNEEGSIGLEKGIFLEICKDAQKNLDDSFKAQIDISEEKRFRLLFESYKDYIQDEIDINQKFIINNTAYITNIEENAFRYQGDNWGNTQRMKFDDIELLYSKNISERKDIKSADGISGLAKQHATYFSYFMKQLINFGSKKNIQIDSVEKVERKNHYLVIDEINRGNISKIFGELITLIEEDKRDTLEVTLPYSKKPFKIPSNLYIIGTMNSTDKSIALIDIALRRRFTFLKMEPNVDLVKNAKAKEIMTQLNKKIIDTLGEDYVLGHSYFMKIENDDDLDFVLEYKIRPLLEEYFYGDEKALTEILKLT